MFTDRADAGRQLAQKMHSYKTDSTIVLALPRGGVVPGAVIAHELGIPLDIVAVRKIGHPGDPEYALGAVDEHGMTLIEGEVGEAWLAEEIRRETGEARRRSAVYRAGIPPVPLAGKTVLLVDDGIATGLTMRLAVRAVRQQKPERIIVAVPVASNESVQSLKNEGVDEIVVLEPTEQFLGSVGAHYRRFDQVEDDEVVNLVQSAYKERNMPAL